MHLQQRYALYASVEHFLPIIEGISLILFTDHKPLLHIFKSKKRNKLERQSRYIEYISQFTTEIRHISGSSNIVADVLNRPEIVAIASPVPTETLIQEQQKDEQIKELRKTVFEINNSEW